MLAAYWAYLNLLNKHSFFGKLKLAAEVLLNYPLRDFDGKAAPAFVTADADFTVVCPLRGLADLISASGVPTYEYYYSHTSSAGCDTAHLDGIIPQGDRHWASHSSELPYVFGVTTLTYNTSCPMSAEEKGLSATMMSYWSSFAANGAPDGGELEPRWAPLRNSTKNYSSSATIVSTTAGGDRGTMGLDLPPAVISGDPKHRVCHFWDTE